MRCFPGDIRVAKFKVSQRTTGSDIREAQCIAHAKFAITQLTRHLVDAIAYFVTLTCNLFDARFILIGPDGFQPRQNRSVA